ncbi:SMP-30/gluconolactonase/LRE family protein [Asinibacterium sp. OR53]|uniref:SMP-30/gluconolactonase/LRE family protein n=1 Tax=Asinibacterium sp. OR53 TaxID=925409 RepID=UPI00047CDCF4|nr:hypothetical protein [Asinibacterium sp. OR53]
MNSIITLFQFVLIIITLLLAVLSSFRIAIFSAWTSLFARSRVGRILQILLLWVAFLVALLGIAIPFFAFFSACLAFLSSIPLALRANHVKGFGGWSLPVVLATVSVFVAAGQPLGLKVLALPKADSLPFRPVAYRVVKTYEEGFGFEGIAASNNGNLYLSGNQDLDFTRSDYYHSAKGKLIERKPDGTEKILFQTPLGFTAGVPVIAEDGSVYLTSHGDTSCIWHIDTSGKANKLAQLPKGAWPNGIDIGPDHMLYSPDSHLGVIWRINPATGSVEEALRDQALLARQFIALAPGANGLHFKGRDMIVTVSDRTTILVYSMDEQGSFGPAKLLAKGIPSDDFAIRQDGSLFITTHPYNTIVHISPSGERIIIGKEQQHILGPTDAVFGRSPSDQNTLYIVTDGGAFTRGAKSRGELIAMEP